LRIALSIVLAFGVYLGFASIFGVNLKEDLALLSIGAIIVMGLSTLFSSALDSNGSLALVLRAILLAFLVSAAFFTLESGTHHLLSSQLPVVMEMNFVEIILISVILFAFGTVTFIQILAPTLSSKPLYRAFAVHLKNGFYANAIFDQVVGAFRITANEKQLHLLYKIKRDSSVHGNGNQETQSKESLKTSSIMQTKDAS
jgi:NAD(P)H-quinone oxidoreductase subunit 5